MYNGVNICRSTTGKRDLREQIEAMGYTDDNEEENDTEDE